MFKINERRVGTHLSPQGGGRQVPNGGAVTRSLCPPYDCFENKFTLRREHLDGERIHLIGEGLRDMAVTRMLAQARSVLALCQRVVVGLARARFCLFYEQLFQQLCHRAADVLRAVVVPA